MSEGPIDASGEDRTRRGAARRVRVRVEESRGARFRKRLARLYTHNRAWLVPVALLVLGVAGIWVAMMFYIGE
jgi:hypothetical protein